MPTPPDNARLTNEMEMVEVEEIELNNGPYSELDEYGRELQRAIAQSRIEKGEIRGKADPAY